MKRIIKGISCLLILLTFLFSFLPFSVFAAGEESGLLDIHQKDASFQTGELTFSHLNFHDNTNNSSNSFGFVGIVSNFSSVPISYVAILSFYDAEGNYIVSNKTYGEAPVGESTYFQLMDTSILNGRDVSVLSKYKLFVETYYDEEEEETIDEITDSYSPSYQDYEISKYHVDIKVNEDNSFDIKESIQANFYVHKHGIIRNIPLRNTIQREDGTTSWNFARISNLKVSDPCTTSRESGEYQIKIGDAKETIQGEKDYTISYTYRLSSDKIKDYDELYFNIIGDQWDTSIRNITFRIQMPKEFDSSKLGFSSGTYGSFDNHLILYQVDEENHVITGSYEGVLPSYSAITVRCELEEGYFKQERISLSLILMYLIPLLFLIISLILWFAFGKDDPVVETVEFYPPDNLNSLDVAFFYKGKADDKDVISLLIYLANKGYIEITEKERDGIFHQNFHFKITKLKDYDGKNSIEERFLKGLFSGKKDHINKKGEVKLASVTDKGLENKFYRTINNILYSTNKKKNKNLIFMEKHKWVTFFSVLCILLSTFTIIAIPTLKYGYLDEAIGDFLILCLFSPFILYSIFSRSMPVLLKLPILLILLPFLVIVLSVSLFGKVLSSDPYYLVGAILGLSCVIGMILCFVFLPKRTQYGTQILGRIRGFKNFLETAEKEKLEALVEENPTYFYDILPYAYVLGVSDKWMKKFESISVMEPSWCHFDRDFNYYNFHSFMNSTMKSAESSMNSAPASGSSSGSSGFSGGSSGGGFSGGGSGGGGGSSW